MNNYENILDLKSGSKIIEEHNENYIKNHLASDKQYLDSILSEVDVAFQDINKACDFIIENNEIKSINIVPLYFYIPSSYQILT